MEEFDFEIFHCAGVRHCNADAMSLRPCRNKSCFCKSNEESGLCEIGQGVSTLHWVKIGIDVEPMATIVRQRLSDTTLERPASTKDPEGGNKSINSAHIRILPIAAKVEVLENLGPIDESTARQPANKVAAVSVDYVDKDKDDDQVFEDLTMISVSEGYENNALLPWSWEGLKQAQHDDPDISLVFQLLQSSQVKPRWEDVALKSADVKTLWGMSRGLNCQYGMAFLSDDSNLLI